MVLAGGKTAPVGLGSRPFLSPPRPGDEGDAARLDDGPIAECRQDEGEIRGAAADQRGELRRRCEGAFARQPPRRRCEALDAIDAQVEEEIAATVDAAKDAPFPDPGAPVTEFRT